MHDRLTKKMFDEDYPYRYKDNLFRTGLDVINKLGQLEDIEEELGIDLATLFKALKNGIYDKKENRNVRVDLVYHSHLKKLVLWYEDYERGPYYNGCYLFEEYGKDWALTKEELL